MHDDSIKNKNVQKKKKKEEAEKDKSNVEEVNNKSGRREKRLPVRNWLVDV